MRPAPDAARAGCAAAKAAGAIAEHAATLPFEDARALLRAEAESLRKAGEPLLLAAMRERIANRSAVFLDWSRDAAAAFGDSDAACVVHPLLAAIVESVKIIDDIQDGERHCLAPLGEALDRIAELPFEDSAWGAAAASSGRAIRETALGQELATRRAAA